MSDKVINIHTKREHTEDDPPELTQAYREYGAARLELSLALGRLMRLEKKFLTKEELARRQLLRKASKLKW